MKRLLATFFLLFFIATLTEAFALTHHFTRELKCPRCKMKIEKKNGCPCHKKKPSATPVIYDPCGGDEGDFHISFDRLSAVIALTVVLPVEIRTERITLPPLTVLNHISEIYPPPPRA